MTDNQMRQSIQNVLKPTEHASGLPNRQYIDPDAYEEEREDVFFRNWAAIGFGKDLPKPGSAKPFDYLGVPLVAVRSKAGEINVFQNTCRHRGMILVDQPLTLKGPIRCPYHSWCYDLDGRLMSTPHVGGSGVNEHAGIDPDKLSLFEIRSHIWRDIIFVNLDGNAAPFEVHAASLIDRWAEFEQPLFHGGADSSIRFDLDTNWKLAVENYCESYHLPWIHPDLNSYSRLEDHYNIQDKGEYSGQGSVVYQQLFGEDGKTFPDFANLSDKWNQSAEYISFFPNALLGVHRDHAFAIILEPKGSERTIEHVEFYYSEELASDAWNDLLVRNAKLWKTVFSEDVDVVEGMQRGRHGVKFDGGKFSPVMDVSTHVFHKWVATQLLS